MRLKIGNVPVEDTYCEAFDGVFSRIIITARKDRYLKRAAYGATRLPSTVVGRTEGGIEKWLSPEETPDGRTGALIQVWGNSPKGFDYEYSLRIRQGILVVPTTRVFNAWDSSDTMDTMERVGHCGDGYEWEEERYGRKMINVPLMMGEWLIERHLGIGRGIMGGNVWFMCDSEDSALEAGEMAVKAVGPVEGAVLTFDICSAGSKVETNFPDIGPTTNHPYCPTLKDRIEGSLVPDGVESIPEMVMNGVDLVAVKRAMKAAMEAAAEVEGVMKISAGNYGGNLGRHKIWLKDLV